jgi:hypothetical protein
VTKLTPEAKSLLSSTIRSLRERLLRDLRDAAEADYRLSVRARDAGLSEAALIRRRRLEAWLDEQARASGPKDNGERQAARNRYLDQAVAEAAATLLNRLVLIRHMEAMKLVAPKVVTGGWSSKAYRELRDFAPELLSDDTEGYALLLDLLFDELALDLPGLFGEVGVTRLLRIPAATLREVVERLDDPGLESAWTDDTTLGWVYQYWNDPVRESLDAKLHAGGKVESHEIAAKTQMFTERYMVEWLLHNSLGLTWLAMCKKHGWQPDAELVLDDLDQRRAEWRDRREAREVALDELMPIAEGLEECWKYYVPQPIPDDAVTAAPETIRGLKLLDPACGSGHFLIIAFDLLVALYREEARHRGETWSEQEIAESILENNLHGVDIDPRAIQIAAAGLFLKARLLSPEARVRRLNLVAPALNLACLPDDDPALQRLLEEVRAEAGIPERLTRKLVEALAGVDHLGTLLKVGPVIDEAIREVETGAAMQQVELFTNEPDAPRLPFEQTFQQRSGDGDQKDSKAVLLGKLESFLSRHRGEEDLGLRLDGEQLAAGVRFMRIVQEGAYDIVVGNPPYQGTSKMVDAKYVAKQYPRAKADLYAAFLERGLELARKGGMSALLTMRGWMFINQFRGIREWILKTFDLRCLGDFAVGAFDEVPNDLLSVVISVIRKAAPCDAQSVATQPSLPDDTSYDRQRTNRKRAAVLAQVGRYEFDPRGFEVIEGEPIVYWWDAGLLSRYDTSEKLGCCAAVKFGANTGNNTRVTRFCWETSIHKVCALPVDNGIRTCSSGWIPFVMGAKGRVWFEPLNNVIKWYCGGLELKVAVELRYGSGGVRWKICNEDFYFKPGIAFSMIGSNFSARAHRYSSIIANKGSSVFPDDIPAALCLMNSATARFVLGSLNPGIGFEVGDVNRLPIFPVASADEIYATLDQAFTEHEAARESSVEFRRPGRSPWLYAQDWAQRSVDRPEGAPLPPYEPEYDPATPEQHLSYAAGVAMGRFGPDGEGILDDTKSEQAALIDNALPAGILFLSEVSEHDSLSHPACAMLTDAWSEHGARITSKEDLRTYLRRSFFGYHKGVYENRPIYFPLSSEKRSFVAWVSIHRWRSDTLQTLLAEHLMPERRRLDGELEDLRQARAGGGLDARTEKRFEQVKKALDELQAFIDLVTQCAEQGPPPTDSKCPDREFDTRFEMDLDDGVMVNSAALWPLLEPQWKTGACPRNWWQELATARGKKDYDWSHLAARYFPGRVDDKCRNDPSLAVAHGCFWRYHPARAYQWELRLQDEIGPDFTIDESDSNVHRARFLAEQADEAAAILAKEEKRRESKRRKAEAEDESQKNLYADQEGEAHA